MSAYIAPLPQQLRDQVVTAYKNHEGGYQALGERFGVATATVRNWVRQARHNGDETLLAVTLGNQVPKTKIDEKGRVFLHLVIEQAPEITILDLVAAYKEAFGIEIAEETMRR
ncbi:MAG: helix-turn-helix domain-containing protein, partial [Deltaproteobacteria bacterium]|nr:helix-turn-helix domain-containing protein [Deltaproteobacteria bacterium]